MAALMVVAAGEREEETAWRTAASSLTGRAAEMAAKEVAAAVARAAEADLEAGLEATAAMAAAEGSAAEQVALAGYPAG